MSEACIQPAPTTTPPPPRECAAIGEKCWQAYWIIVIIPIPTQPFRCCTGVCEPYSCIPGQCFGRCVEPGPEVTGSCFSNGAVIGLCD